MTERGRLLEEQREIKYGLPIRFSNYSVVESSSSGERRSARDYLNHFVQSDHFWKHGQQQLHSPEYSVAGVDGIVHQGELLLIIGPPSSNAGVLLRSLSSPNDLKLGPTSQLDYGLISPDIITRPTSFFPLNDQHGRLRSEVVFLSEHDVHFPSISVEASLLPASIAKTPSRRSRGDAMSRKEWARKQLDGLLASVALSNALKTKMGSSIVQGLSGGERKRASIVESLLTRASVLLLESPLNGLDSSSALATLSFLRQWTKEGRRSLVVTSPHIADNLYSHFDKVLVLNSRGRQVYFGSAHLAQSYFEMLGYPRSIQEGIAEFVVNCIGDGDNDAELEKSWESSHEKKSLMAEMKSYDVRYRYFECAGPLLSALEREKSSFQSKSSPFIIPFLYQVALLTHRQYALILSELPSYVTKTIVNILLSLLVGTVFLSLPPTTDAAFTRAGLLLLSIMFNGYLAIGELGKTLEGRDIVKRQRDYGFFSASALSLARVAGDLPLIGVQVLLFGTMTYLLAGLQRSLEKFAVYLVFVYVMALNLSSMFRMLGSLSPNFDVAISACGFSLNILVVYAGYFIPTPSMVNTLKFVHYVIDPVSYAFEAVLTNEFHGLALACSPSDIVPSGPSYSDAMYQTCSLPGSTPGSLVVLGDDYLSTAYDFHHDRIWINLGILILQALVFIIISIVATDFLEFTRQGNKQIWIKDSSRLRLGRSKRDRTGIRANSTIVDVPGEESVLPAQILQWSDISLWVDTDLETRKLLDGICGYVRGGSLMALMGVSGAGKTTLLNILAGRSGNVAVVRGSISIDGKTPDDAFYRRTGFVQQFDHHDDRSTVREALEFSALLRQDVRLSRVQKLAYVDVVLDLLDLSELSDAIIGTPSAGLNSEQRKRLTIAVEVVARPTVLFCDEPTTNLDTKSALRVVRLLQKLSRTGIPVIATIHQPSMEAFNLFDDLLLLERGGRQVYFGPRLSALDYFGIAPVDATANPADLLLAIAASTEEVTSSTSTLATKWKRSMEARAMRSIIASTVTTTRSSPSSHTTSSFSSGRVQQCRELTLRVSRHFYRDHSYSYTKIITAFSVSTIIGLSFLGVGRESTIVSFQNRMFSIFLILFLPPVFMNLTIFKQHKLRSLFDQRENCIYGRTAFVTSLIVSELPYCVGSATIYFSIFYFFVGFPLVSSTIAYTLAMVQLFFLFQSTWAMWITALAPDLGTIANMLPFFLVSAEVFNGALMPYSSMPIYWRWLYWISPFQWYVRGMLGVLLHDVPVECSASELVSFRSPAGQSCVDYMSEFLSSNMGHLVETRDDLCSYCRFSVGDDFLSSLNISHSSHSSSLAILFGFTISNIALIYLLTYLPPRMLKLPGRGSMSKAEIAAGAEERERIDEEAIVEGRRGGL